MVAFGVVVVVNWVVSVVVGLTYDSLGPSSFCGTMTTGELVVFTGAGGAGALLDVVSGALEVGTALVTVVTGVTGIVTCEDCEDVSVDVGLIRATPPPPTS